jgi:hypothetical protein
MVPGAPLGVAEPAVEPLPPVGAVEPVEPVELPAPALVLVSSVPVTSTREFM